MRAVGGAIGYSIYYNIFRTKINAKLPLLVGEYAVGAGLPLAQAKTFVETYFYAPDDLVNVPGVTPAVLDGALTGSQWAYAESLHYVWSVFRSDGLRCQEFC